MTFTKENFSALAKERNWTDDQFDAFVASANNELVKTGNLVTAIENSLTTLELTNAKQFPRIYYCSHMLPGVAGYQDENLLIDADAMKRAAPSFVGKPVYVQHQKVNLDTIHEDADGWVVDCFYNELDGWLWAKMLITSDEGHRAIERKWSVSNSYLPQAWDGKGQHLAIDYDRKITDYSFTHLAIVPNPRYEAALIYTPEAFKEYQSAKRNELQELQNSKPTSKGHPMLKFFLKEKKELTGGIPADAHLSTIEVQNADGTLVPLDKVLEIVNAQKKNEEDEAAKKKAEEEKENKKVMWNDDTEVSVGGETMPMSQLMNKYNACMKKNAEDEEAKKKADEKENADAELAKAKEKEEKEKENTRFKELQNAHHKAETVVVETSMDKTARGKTRYGSKK